MSSVLSVLLVIGVAGTTAHQAATVEPDHLAITCPERFASAILLSSCQLESSLEPHFGRDPIAVQSLFNCYALSKCLEVDRITHINCRLNVVRYVMSTVAVVVIVGAISRLLSGGLVSLGASYNYVRPRGRYNSVIGASEPVENNSPPLGSAPSFTNRTTSVDLAAHLSLIAQEPQSGEGSKTVLEPTEAVSGLQRGPSCPIRQSSPPTIDDTRLHPSNAIWGNFIPYFGDRSAGTDLPTEPLWARFSPSKYLFRVANDRLLWSLYGWRPPIFVLVIAVDDATHDHGILELALKSSTSVWVHFSGLATNVTFESINTSIRQLYDKSMKVPGSELFILLTGHGDDFNRMILPENEFIDEADLFSMLRKIQNDYSRFIPVTTLFDICRLSLKPGTPAPEGISIAWACLPGQIAGACQFPGPPCPNSCFLIALMMASRMPGLHYTSDALKKIVQERLDQLTGYLKELYATKHPGGRCGRCSDMLKPCDEPRRQNVDWGDANDLGGLLELTRALSTSEITNSVNQRFMGEGIFYKVVGTPRRLSGDLLPQNYALGSVLSLATDRVDEESKPRMGATAPALPDTAHDFNPPLEDNTKKHERGANEHVHAG